MQVTINIHENVAFDILRLMHAEYVRLLAINYTTKDEDEQADAANDAVKVGLTFRALEEQLLAMLGQKRMDLAKDNFEREFPTPQKPL